MFFISGNNDSQKKKVSIVNPTLLKQYLGSEIEFQVAIFLSSIFLLIMIYNLSFTIITQSSHNPKTFWARKGLIIVHFSFFNFMTFNKSNSGKLSKSKFLHFVQFYYFDLESECMMHQKYLSRAIDLPF